MDDKRCHVPEVTVTRASSRSVKFDLRPESDMSSQSSPRRSSTKDSSPQRNARRSSIKDTSPKRSTSKDTSPRRGSTKDVSGRRGSSFSPSKLSPKVSPTNRRKSSLKNSPSPDRAKGGSGAVTRKSLSPVKSGLANRKRSPSLSKTLSSKSLIKDQSAASSRDDKKIRPPSIPQPELTASGLKIIDWSGQGMTSIPFNLLNPKDTVGELNVSSNNIRSVSTEIRNMKKLEKLDLSKNGIRCSSSTDFGGLPAEMAQLTCLTELNIAECNLPFIPPAIFRISSLKVLNLSRNKVNILLPEIGQLTKLVQLNLQQTNITSLPPEIAQCLDLEEVYLWGNSIETLPDTLSRLTKLRVLALNYRSFCSVVNTPYMEGLLRKGQIKSEHIPAVVFEMAGLQVLDLENTKLNSLPYMANTNLEELYLSKNFLQTIPDSIYNLQMLKILDLSHNQLTEFHEDIGRLKSLKVLRMACNKLDLIPRTIANMEHLEELNLAENNITIIPPEIRYLQALKILVLEQNSIILLPDEFCELTQLHTLDLTSNKIRTLPMELHRLKGLTQAHVYHQLVKAGLWLYKNPLEQPPPEIWRTDKPENIFKYLKKLMIIKTENLQRQKIMLLGESQCGKTSLAHVLSQRKPKLSDGVREKTRILKQTIWKTENNVEFVLNDFGGDIVYRTLYKLFLDSKALVLLVYNAATFNENRFYDAIGQWLDMLRASCPGVVVKVIGAQVDLLHQQEDEDDLKTIVSEQELKALCAPSEDFEEDEEDDALSIGHRSEMESIRNTSTPAVPEKPHHELAMDLTMQHLNKKDQELQEELKILESDIASLEKPGQAELTDMEEAILKLLRIRQQKIKFILLNPLKIIPGVASVSSSNSMEGIVQLVDELEHATINQQLFPHAQRHIPAHWKRLGAAIKQTKGPYLYWDDVQDVADRYDVKEAELKECVRFMCDVGDIIWYENDPGLSQIVFQKPKLLTDMMSSLYRHDMREFLNYENKVFMCKGRLNREQFQESANHFLLTGELARPLLNSLWFHLKLSNEDTEEMLELLPMFEICYTIPEPDIPTSPIHNRPVLVLPWYNRDCDLSPLKEVWPANSHSKELAVVFTFPFHCPSAIFLNISAQIHDFLDERMDWQDHIYASTESEKLFLQQSHKEDATVITIVVRGPEFAAVQELMEDMVDVVNSEIVKYPGLYWKVKIPMGASSLQLATLSASDYVKLNSSGRRMSRPLKPLSSKN
ncbi:malignant fibrous histiocytoma-amplified sequence 1 [Biomphalaria glabrata]|uniref:non-specific serine/threonine protein kinase n=2 Tax=Biomphalaria glabrata TaxID=6526 RepID=A0A9W3BKL3_BIOGL|nr:malignant fibrous histiocytoma-amplified sequence 1 homolog isoform X1 [Biomphalaria glabrata]KAI8760074.1 putative malignant fibrous histiocytoma-amplified sequence 1 [Biomphalaria glabrata]